MQRLKQLLAGFMIMVTTQIVYAMIQNISFGSHDFSLAIDGALPFLPGWIWVYISVFPVFLAASLILDPINFSLTAWRVLIANCLSLPVFILARSNYPRPDPTLIVEPLYRWGYSLMFSLDKPNNTLPSLHVSLTCIITYALVRSGRVNIVVGVMYATLVSLSTLFTKQHFVWDVVGGVAVWVLSVMIVDLLRRQKSHNART